MYLDSRHICFGYNATSDDIVDNTVEQVDLENIGITVGILLLYVPWNSRYDVNHK